MRIAALLLIALAGCDGCRLDLERMINQPRFDTYQACRVCPDGTVMQTPPPGAVPRDPAPADPAIARAVEGGGWVDEIPVRVDRALLRRGRDRFDIVCATCHGPLGDGISQVAKDMKLRPPPSLVDPPVSDYPAGRIYLVATAGWGLMPQQATALEVRDRWAVIAYIEALRLRRARLDELPPGLRERARRSLP